MSDRNSSDDSSSAGSTGDVTARIAACLGRVSLWTTPPKADVGVETWSAAAADQAMARLTTLGEMVASAQSSDEVAPAEALAVRLLLSDLALTVSFLRASAASARRELDRVAADLEAAPGAIADLRDEHTD